MSDYWKDNGIEKPQQIIVCAAIRIGDWSYLLCGARHWDSVMHKQADKMGLSRKLITEEQGFIDQFGEFLSRKEAMKIVKENGQPFNIERNGGSDDELYSEGLY